MRDITIQSMRKAHSSEATRIVTGAPWRSSMDSEDATPGRCLKTLSVSRGSHGIRGVLETAQANKRRCASR
jgi:hypothetical protein